MVGKEMNSLWMKDIPHRALNEAFPPEVCIFNFHPCETSGDPTRYTILSMERLCACSVVLFFDYPCTRHLRLQPARHAGSTVSVSALPCSV